MSPYLRSLRAVVGHDLLLLPTVAVLPRSADGGSVLLVRELEGGRWMTIGGMVEPGESPEEAARREAQEEAGVEVEVGRLLGAFGGPGYEAVHANGDRAAFVPIGTAGCWARRCPASETARHRRGGRGYRFPVLEFAIVMAVIAVFVIVLVGGLDALERVKQRSVGQVDPERVLASRFASGEIDEVEYSRRLSILRLGPPLELPD